MKTKSLAASLSIASTLCYSGCTDGSMGRSMGGWGHMMGYGGYGGMIMWLILIIVVGIIIYFAFSQNKIPGDSTDIPGETPMDILKKRYARGEISKEEFDRIKSEIEKQPESRVLCNDYQALRAK